MEPVAYRHLDALIALKADPRVFAVMLGGVRPPRRAGGGLAEEMAPVTGPIPAGSVDLIYQNMVSEWLDPSEVQQLAVPQDWKSVWDNGWAAAAEADNVPVEEHTDRGLPVRAPGARLIPGGATPPGEAEQLGEEAQDTEAGADTDDSYPERDPQAIRASMSNHFGGVRAARSHARNTTQGLDEQ